MNRAIFQAWLLSTITSTCGVAAFAPQAFNNGFSSRRSARAMDVGTKMGSSLVLPKSRTSSVDVSLSSTTGEITETDSATTTLTPPTSFDDGMAPFEITTPIYYVNDKPHIGHAYTSTACDVLARFMRLSGREVFFLSGTDEHGQKVEQSAANRGVEPQEFVDEVSQSFRDLLTLMNISNDEFIRTTSDEHQKSVQVSVECAH